MNPLFDTSGIIEYKEQIIRQREVLHLSTVFDTNEAIQVHNIYCELEAICNKKLDQLKEQEAALTL